MRNILLWVVDYSSTERVENKSVPFFASRVENKSVPFFASPFLDDLQQDRRVVGWTTSVVILEAMVKDGQIELMIDQIIDRMFKGA